MKVAVRLLWVLALCHGFSPLLLADPVSYVYTTIDFPGGSQTSPEGINDLGQIVGSYAGGANFNYHGFVYSNGAFSNVDAPSPGYTLLDSINNSGHIVGESYSLGIFSDINGSFQTLNLPPGATGFHADLNNSGQIVGTYRDSLGIYHDYLYSGGAFTTLDVPSSFGSTGIGAAISNSGRIAETFVSPAFDRAFGLVNDNGALTLIDVPGSSTNNVVAINDKGQVAGMFSPPSPNNGAQVAYVANYSSGLFTTIQVPGSLQDFVTDMNDLGQIVGTWEDAAGVDHGFLATPVPEPSSFALMTIAVLAGAGTLVWKRFRDAVPD